MQVSKNTTQKSAIEMIYNAARLNLAKRFAAENNISFKKSDESNSDITYVLMDENTPVELVYCSVCLRSLVDTSYCDGCDEDAENSFNQSDF